MNKISINIPKIILLLTSVAAVASVFISLYAFRGEATSSQVALIIGVLPLVLNIGAIALFITGLRNFSNKLKIHYATLGAGVFLLSLGQAQIPYVILTEDWAIVESGLSGIPFILSVILMFWGMRKISTLLRIKTPWSSVPLLILTAIATSMFVILLPRTDSTLPEAVLLATIALITYDMVFEVFCAGLAYTIKQKTSSAYRATMGWLFWAFLAMLPSALFYLATYLYLSEGNWFYDYNIISSPFFFSSLFFLLAGFWFTKIVESSEKIKPSNFLGLDIVLFSANLVSNPSDIDVLLDTVREISSESEKQTSFTTQQLDKLKDTYLAIEEYLTTQENLRSFTVSGLRQYIETTFNLQDHSDKAFWDKLPPNEKHKA
ncbi:MAG: hypothetical protein U5K77_00115 [Candidatus Saccharibacteria bacterium]|nr:hypothetical protein [Candidatus Saccharibacteria bacterium]